MNKKSIIISFVLILSGSLLSIVGIILMIQILLTDFSIFFLSIIIISFLILLIAIYCLYKIIKNISTNK